MLDHVFTDAIGALREALEKAFLERHAFEEGFKADILLGDLSWETSYGLPGEGSPPRVQADLTLDWPTWAQTSYRSWYIGEPMDEGPRIDIEIVVRIQRLRASPDPGVILAVLPRHSPAIGLQQLERSGPTVATTFDDDISNPEYAIEVSYVGSYELDDETLADGNTLDDHFGDMGGWITHMLVQLGDITLEFLPPSE